MHAHARAQAPKTNRQQLAVVGAVYTIAPWVRPPEAGAASLFRDPGAAPGLAKRPAPQPQRRWARLPHARGQSTGAATDEPLGWRAQVAQRNPTAAPPRGLMDGQQSWGEAGQRPFPPPQPVEILALLQATPRLGAAAHLVYRCDTAHALRWGDDRVRRILHGDVRAVVSGLRQRGTTRKRRGKQRDKLAALCGYLHNHAPRMRDEAYLAAGSPLASGGIEGACRPCVTDRMERSGMRWPIESAPARLDGRSTYRRGEWATCMSYRSEPETQRVSPHRALVEPSKT